MLEEGTATTICGGNEVTLFDCMSQLCGLLVMVAAVADAEFVNQGSSSSTNKLIAMQPLCMQMLTSHLIAPRSTIVSLDGSQTSDILTKASPGDAFRHLRRSIIGWQDVVRERHEREIHDGIHTFPQHILRIPAASSCSQAFSNETRQRRLTSSQKLESSRSNP